MVIKKKILTTNTKLCFQTTRCVVDSSMKDTAVVASLVECYNSKNLLTTKSDYILLPNHYKQNYFCFINLIFIFFVLSQLDISADINDVLPNNQRCRLSVIFKYILRNFCHISILLFFSQNLLFFFNNIKCRKNLQEIKFLKSMSSSQISHQSVDYTFNHF